MTEHLKPAPLRGKPGRAPAGHVEWTGRVWRVRVTMSDGRRWIALPTSLGPDDRVQAQALAKQVQEAARGAVAVGDVVTVATYATRWVESLPPGPTRGTYGRALTGHVLPTLGAMNVATVASKDVRALVSKWDAAVAKGEQAPSSVRGYWTVCSLLFKSACSSKRDDLRVRTDNPCAGVEGPNRARIETTHQWLYPSEFLKVMACPLISAKVRYWIALFVLTGCRLNELRGLRWRDIDLARDVVHIRGQLDPRTGALRPTKGKRARTIPLEPTLRPLLEASQGAPDDYVVTIPKGQVQMLLRALRLAGVTRPELFERSASSNPLRVHDLRASYGTWCALRGDPPLAIQRRLGHASLDQTQVYLRTAELFGAKGEVPFARFEIVLSVPGYVPAVPGALTGHREKGSNVEEGYNSPLCDPDRINPPKHAENREADGHMHSPTVAVGHTRNADLTHSPDSSSGTLDTERQASPAVHDATRDAHDAARQGAVRSALEEALRDGDFATVAALATVLATQGGLRAAVTIRGETRRCSKMSTVRCIRV